MSNPAEWGPEFLVNTETNVTQRDSDIVVLPDGRFVIVWWDNNEFFEDDRYQSIRLQVFEADGTKSGPERVVKEAQPDGFGTSLKETILFPYVTLLPDGNLLLTYHLFASASTSGPRYQVLSSEGDVVVAETPVPLEGHLRNVTALDDGRLVSVRGVADTSGDVTVREVRLQYFDSDISPVGNEVTIYEFSVQVGGLELFDIEQLAGGRILVTWKDGSDGLTFGSIKGQLVNEDGSLAGEPFDLTPPERWFSANFRYDVVSLENGNFVVTWVSDLGVEPRESGHSIQAQIFDASGNALGDRIYVNSTRTQLEENVKITSLPDGGFVVVWLSEDYDNDDFGSVVAQIINADGSKRGGEIVLSNTAYDPLGNLKYGEMDIESLGDGRVVVSWTDVGQHLGDESWFAVHAQIIDSRTGAVSLVGTGSDDRLAGTNFNDSIDGAGGQDLLFGADGADTLNGGDQNDVLSGGSGGDTLDGGSGQDSASYESALEAVRADLAQPGLNAGDAAGDSYKSIENLIGSRFDDSLSGDTANNSLSGLTGDDLLLGGLGNDTLDGGAGVDTATYRAGASGGVTIDLSDTGPQNTGSAGSDTLISIENVGGTDFQDSLTGDAGSNVIEGFDGADTLDGGLGRDTLSYAASTGSVTVNLSTSQVSGGHGTGDVFVNFENVIGSGFNDVLTGDAGDNVLDGGVGADTLDGGSGSDTASYINASGGVIADLTIPAFNAGEAAGDTYTSIENLEGSAFDDGLFGDNGVNDIRGLLGDDVIEGGAGGDVLDGGAGNDLLSYYSSSAAVTVDLNLLTASGGDAQGDTISNFEDLIGSQFADVLTGNNGDNILEGGAGADVLDGWNGNDAVSYLGSTVAVNVNLETGEATGGDAQGDTFTRIESIIGSNFDDVLVGTNDSGAHVLVGADGNDQLVAGTFGSDLLLGGDGNDLLTNGADDTLEGGAGNDTIEAFGGRNTLKGGDGNDVLKGGVQIDTAASFNGDVLDGGAGNDVILADAGHDSIIAGLGDDSIDGGSGNDTISYAETSQGVVVDLGSLSANGLDIGNDTIENVEGIVGGTGDDRITGDANGNIIEGGRGNDTLDGGAGIDTVNFFDTTDGVTVDLGAGTASGSEIDSDIISGFENVTGGLGDDSITGDAGDNYLFGYIGADTVAGGAGDDTVVATREITDRNTYAGDTGIDTLVFQYAVEANMATGLATAISGGLQDTISGFEIVVGSDENDRLIGDAGDNVLQGEAGSDHLIGGVGNDTIDGGGHDDFIDGGEGNDALTGSFGTDTINGGLGDDTIDAEFVDYSSTLLGVDVNLATQTASGVEAGTDTLINVHGVIGGQGADTMVGGDLADNLSGGGGNDTIDGAAGSDTIDGGEGSDTIDGGAGDDLIQDASASGNDNYDGGAGFDTLSYFLAARSLTVDLTTSTVSGPETGTDTISNIEKVVAGMGDDTILGNGDGNDLGGFDGNDFIDGAAGNDSLDGGRGNDSIDGGAGNDTIQGGDGNDTIEGGAGNDTVRAFWGDDLVIAGEGDDSYEAGGTRDFDTISFAGTTLGVTVDFETRLASGAETGNDTINGFEAVIGGAGADVIRAGFTSDLLEGGAGNDILEGRSGDDTVLGGLGDDRIVDSFGSGNDVYDGGAGNDTVDFTGTGFAVSVNLATGTASTFPNKNDTLSNIENAIGDTEDDSIRGDSGANRLEGAGGADDLWGGGGNDHLEGGTGDDILRGEAGNDYLDAGAGNDALAGHAGNDILFGGAGNDFLYGNGDDDQLWGGTGNDVLNGNEGADVLRGESGDDYMNGGDGNDALAGHQGADQMFGGAGNDFLYGNGDDDMLWGGTGNDVLKGNEGADILRGESGNDYLDGGEGNDALAGHAGADTLIGGGGNDFLYGNGDNDKLFGGTGNDVLKGEDGDDELSGEDGTDYIVGGSGLDTMSGGAGADTFVFADNAGSDTILDFEDGLDVLNFAGVTSVAGIGDLTINAISGTETEIAYDDGNGVVTLTVQSSSPFTIDQDDFVF